MTPTEATILLIEGKRADHPSFYAGLTRKGFQVELVSSGNMGLIALQHSNKPHIVVINAASMRTSGRRICKSIRDLAGDIPLVLIIEEGTRRINQFDADVILVLPFTLQKLLNRIRLLAPPENTNLLEVGPIQLDMENNWVRCGEKHTGLTPRLVSLLKVLMENPGDVLERTELFREVWETTYIGDTRTMDVHISWLRQAIEENPRHPKYIKTVRGIGYRLDIKPE